MSNLDALIKYFENFPGIGGRQARRFAFHILTMPAEDVARLASLITDLQGTVAECTSCHRFFSKNGSSHDQCAICSDFTRDTHKLAIVERDSDVTTIERAGVYDGLYFVLGGTVPLLDSKETGKLRGGALKSLVAARLKEGLSEIILAFSANPDGENTGRFVESILRDIDGYERLTVSQLGRGLSTGSELEYADPETIKNSFKNRT